MNFTKWINKQISLDIFFSPDLFESNNMHSKFNVIWMLCNILWQRNAIKLTNTDPYTIIFIPRWFPTIFFDQFFYPGSTFFFELLMFCSKLSDHKHWLKIEATHDWLPVGNNLIPAVRSPLVQYIAPILFAVSGSPSRLLPFGTKLQELYFMDRAHYHFL